jgi:hypothetical protein
MPYLDTENKKIGESRDVKSSKEKFVYWESSANHRNNGRA